MCIRDRAYTAQIAALAFLAKAVGEANGNEKAKAFDLVHELSLVAVSYTHLIDTRNALIRECFSFLKNLSFLKLLENY